jgi:hypothetical protein
MMHTWLRSNTTCKRALRLPSFSPEALFLMCPQQPTLNRSKALLLDILDISPQHRAQKESPLPRRPFSPSLLPRILSMAKTRMRKRTVDSLWLSLRPIVPAQPLPPLRIVGGTRAPRSLPATAPVTKTSKQIVARRIFFESHKVLVQVVHESDADIMVPSH